MIENMRLLFLGNTNPGIRYLQNNPPPVLIRFVADVQINATGLGEFLGFLFHSSFGTPDDIAGVTSFLCSEDASYVTGENLVAAGGLTSRL